MRFYLCDDDKTILTTYRDQIDSLCKKHHINHETSCYLSGENLLFNFEHQSVPIGIIFLDINMKDTNGIAVAQRLREIKCKSEIIFLTVSKKHFLSAFDVGAFNYLVKGETSEKRFEQVFLNAVAAVEDKLQQYMIFTSGGIHRNIALREITYFEIIKRIITVHYGEGKTFDFFSTITKIEGRLLGRGFVRAHRSFLVSIAAIEKIQYDKAMLKDGTIIPIGRQYLPNVRKAFQEYEETIGGVN